MRWSTSSPMTPVVAQPDHGLALGGRHAIADLEVVERLRALGVLRGLLAAVGQMLASCVVAGLELVDQLEVPGYSARARSAGASPARRPPGGPGSSVSGRSSPRPQSADQPGQGEALPDERGEDHAERQEDHQVTSRKMLVERQGERRGERHDPAHPRPGDDEDGRPAGTDRARSFALSQRGR